MPARAAGRYWGLLSALRERDPPELPEQVRALGWVGMLHVMHDTLAWAASSRADVSRPVLLLTAACPSSVQYSEAFRAFIRECLHKDPAMRPTARALVGHDFITQNCIIGAKVRKKISQWLGWADKVLTGRPTGWVLPWGTGGGGEQ